jgi:DNA gyrase subunit A
VVMATRSGEIKRTSLGEFASVRSGGLIAIGLEEDDELVSARVAHQGDDVILVTESGQAIRFAVAGLRSASRFSGGVRAIQITPGDRVVAMDIVSPSAYLLVVTKNGFGKCTPLSEYRTQARGGRGVKSLSITPKTGRVIAGRIVNPAEELMILSAKGIVIRIRVEDIPVQGRIRRGASLMKLDEGDEVVSIAALH